jgi:hypothetical protein
VTIDLKILLQVAAEEELGLCSPKVFQVNTIVIVLDGVSVWRNQ